MNICCYSKRKNNDLMTTAINFSDPKFVTNPEDQILLLHKLLWLQARDVVFLDDQLEQSTYHFTSLTKKDIQQEDLDFFIELTRYYHSIGNIAYQTLYPNDSYFPEIKNKPIEEKSKNFGSWFSMEKYQESENWIKENKNKTFVSPFDFMQVLPYDGNAAEHLKYLKKLCQLSQDEYVFFTTYSESDKDWLENKVFPTLLCSDTFGMACADAERFQQSDIDLVLDMKAKFGYAGIVAWISKQRKEKPLLEYARLDPQKYAEAVAYLEMETQNETKTTTTVI